MSITYNTSIVRNGLVLHLDAANRKSYPGSGTTWFDLSGQNNNGTLTNGPIFDSGSITFDGVNDFVNGPINGGLGTDITVEMFVNITNSMAGKIFFGLDTNTHASLGIYVNINNLIWYWNTGDSFNTPFSQNITLTVGQWNHIVVSTAIADNNAKLYQNGNLIGTSFYKNTTTTGTGDKYQIGRYFNNAYYANCKYSVFKIYNKALSNVEIQQNFESLRGRYGI